MDICSLRYSILLLKVMGLQLPVIRSTAGVLWTSTESCFRCRRLTSAFSPELGGREPVMFWMVFITFLPRGREPEQFMMLAFRTSSTLF